MRVYKLLKLWKPWASQVWSCIHMNSPFSQGLSVEVLPASWLPGHESDWGCPAWKAQADPGLWAPHEHHCWCHHWSAFHQKQGDSCSPTCLFSSIFLLLSFFFANLCDLPSSLCCSLCLLSLDSYLSYSCWFMFYAFSNFNSQVVQGFSRSCVCDVHTKYQDKCMYKSRSCFFCEGRQSFLLLPLNIFLFRRGGFVFNVHLMQYLCFSLMIWQRVIFFV